MAFQYGTIQTTTIGNTTLVTFSLGSDAQGWIDCVLVAHYTGSDQKGVFQIRRGFKTVASSATALGSSTKDTWADAGFTGDCQLVATGGSMVLQAVGVAATTINWTVLRADIQQLSVPPPST
jgi:hypothetical protein